MRPSVKLLRNALVCNFFFLQRFYARDAAMLARVLAMAMCLSVSVSVRLESVFCRNGSTNRAGFWYGSFIPPILLCVKRVTNLAGERWTLKTYAQVYAVYSNLNVYTGGRENCLCINRREPGLHNPEKGNETLCRLMSVWNDDYIRFPENVVRLHWDGSPMGDRLY